MTDQNRRNELEAALEWVVRNNDNPLACDHKPMMEVLAAEVRRLQAKLSAPDSRTDASTSGKKEPGDTSPRNLPACSPSVSDSAPSPSVPMTPSEEQREAAFPSGRCLECAGDWDSAQHCPDYNCWKTLAEDQHARLLTAVQQSERGRA
jgi:hypothetical protein